ncbi:hypothetical protein ALC57_02507 [Trachymyrmex cornetzi]|uniref:Uncharacterized protein n=1 Tax=Trachymyrmex cornetzi TaxID=471704 RepID=A0A195EIS8_9HYME|nr:hypothetical protein ALC57_02507 [Trachymyrmex cornetzi]
MGEGFRRDGRELSTMLDGPARLVHGSGNGKGVNSSPHPRFQDGSLQMQKCEIPYNRSSRRRAAPTALETFLYWYVSENSSNRCEGKVPPTNNDIPRSGYLSGFDKFATNYGPESWSCRLMSYRLTYPGTTTPNVYNGVAKYCETKARLTFVSLEMTFLSRHYNVAKRRRAREEEAWEAIGRRCSNHGVKQRLFFFFFLNTNFHAFYYDAIFFTYCIQRSNTFVADLRISVTGAVLRDNSIKVMPDMAKGER